MPKITEVKLSSCELEVADFRKNCDCRFAELRLRSKISLKVAELRKVVRFHLCLLVYPCLLCNPALYTMQKSDAKKFIFFLAFLRNIETKVVFKHSANYIVTLI
jgi:hypothetical protein